MTSYGFFVVIKALNFSASTRCCVGDGFESQQNTSSQLKTLKIIPMSSWRQTLVRVCGMPCLKTGANLYHTQLGLLDKDGAIKYLVFFRTFDQENQARYTINDTYS